jgi:carotenoid cleavage dioxygenase-like enzyme
MDWADWRAGYASQPREHCYWVHASDVTGTLPAALHGSYFRNGPGARAVLSPGWR